MNGLGEGEEQGIRPSGGLQASGGLTSSADAEKQGQESGLAIEQRRRQRAEDMALAGFAQAFKDVFGFEVIITPDNAGRVIYGNGKITLELRMPKPGGQAIASDPTPASFPFRGYIESVSGTPKVRIQNGDVNSEVPPEVQGGSAPVDYDTDDYVYYIEAEVDEDGIFTGTVSIGRGASVPADTDSVVHRRLFEVQDGEVLQSVQNSLEFAMCAGFVSWGSV